MKTDLITGHGCQVLWCGASSFMHGGAGLLLLFIIGGAGALTAIHWWCVGPHSSYTGGGVGPCLLLVVWGPHCHLSVVASCALHCWWCGALIHYWWCGALTPILCVGVDMAVMRVVVCWEVCSASGVCLSFTGVVPVVGVDMAVVRVVVIVGRCSAHGKCLCGTGKGDCGCLVV